ncbi:MAG: hypothetical protein FJ290_15065 [Planctomycetes bacterium]|nr:hypothetical protein [Planctomycetota bacterium]
METDDTTWRLGDVLVAAGLLSPAQVDEAAARQRALGCRLGEALIRDGVLSQDQVNWALARHLRLPYVEVSPDSLDGGLARRLRPGLLYQHVVIPLVQLGDVVTLAMADPTDTEAVREVADALGCRVQRAIARSEAIRRALDAVLKPAGLPPASPATPPATSRKAPAKRRRLGEILLDSLLITEQQLAEALAAQATCHRRLGEILIERHICTEDQVCWALAHHLGVPYIDLQAEALDPTLRGLLPIEFLRAHAVVPVVRIEGEVVLAMADPLDDEAIARAREAAAAGIIVAIARREPILAAIARLAAEAEPVPSTEPQTPERPPLAPEAEQAFRQAIQQSSLPLADRIKTYAAVRRLTALPPCGDPEAARAARRQHLAGLSTDALKLALRLIHILGKAAPPDLLDADLAPPPARPRLVADRRLWEATLLDLARRHNLRPEQIGNATLAARAWTLSGGRQKILLVTPGECELAVALTKLLRLEPSPPAPPAEAPAAP